MPFSEDFEDIYLLGIKPACTGAGGYCQRVDEQIFHESILERIYNQINKADLIVADMTGRNANVFYETGYAHALGKRVILLTQSSDDIPFDLKHYPHIVYSRRIAQLKQELQRRVTWYLAHSDGFRATADTFEQIEFYVGGQKVEPDAELELPDESISKFQDEVHLSLPLSLHNPTQQIIRPDSRVALLGPEFTVISQFAFPRPTRLPNGKVFMQSRRVTEIAPFSWSNLKFDLELRRPDWEGRHHIPVTMRIPGTESVKDISFRLVIPKAEDNDRSV